MDCEHKLKIVEQELASLREENRLLKEKLSALEHGSDKISFKEKYAVKILDSLPDMLTVFNHEETGIEVVSNEETNHEVFQMKPLKECPCVRWFLKRPIIIFIIIF